MDVDKKKHALRSTIRYIPAFILITILVLSVGFAINMRIYYIMREQTFSVLYDISELQKEKLLESINKDINFLELSRDTILSEYLKDNNNPVDLVNVLNSVGNGRGFSQILLADTDGNALDINGVQLNLESKDYFKTALSGENSISTGYIGNSDNEKNEESIILSLPILKNKQVVGTMHGIYSEDAKRHMLLQSYRRGEGVGWLIKPNGDLIVEGENQSKISTQSCTTFIMNNKNFYEALADYKLSDKWTAEALQQKIVNLTENEVVAFELKYGSEHGFVHASKAGINDWTLLTVTDSCTVVNNFKSIHNLVIFLIIFIGLVFVCLTIFMVFNLKRYWKLLLEKDRSFEALMGNIQGGVISCRTNKRTGAVDISYISEGWVTLTGYTRDEINTLYSGNPRLIILEEDRPAVNEDYMAQTATSNSYQLNYRLRKKDGEILWVIDKGVVMDCDIDSSSKDEYMENQSIMTDVTDMKKQEEAFRISEERFRISTMVSSLAIYEYDIASNTFIHFENLEQLLGITEDVRGISAEDFIKEIVHPDDFGLVLNSKNLTGNQTESSCEARYLKSDGNYIWCKVYNSLVLDSDGNRVRILGSLVDIDASKRKSELLALQVQTEPLTGLFNKVAARAKVDEFLIGNPVNIDVDAIISETNEKNITGINVLILLDVDNFKGINDSMGHTFGDTVLIEVAGRLRQLFRSNDVVARVGGDEFLVFAPNMQSVEAVKKKAAEVCSAFRQTYMGEKKDYKISCSIGVAAALPSDNFDDLFERADIAMYDAKSYGKDRFVLYEDGVDYHSRKNTKRRRNQNDIESLVLSLNDRIFDLMYNSVDFTASMQMSLFSLSRYSLSDHVCVVEYDDGYTSCTTTFEWHKEANRMVNGLEKCYYADTDRANSYFELFDRHGVLISLDVRELPEPWGSMFLESTVSNIIQIAIADKGKFKGVICFGNCFSNGFDKNDEDNLSVLVQAAKILGAFLLKQRAEERCINL